MENLVEIRWHGRGGQGAKTASLLLADAAFNTGKYIQGFPEYGPERMGAPITAYNRISNSPIVIHSNIYEPDYVVVVDDTLIETVDVTAGLKETGAIVINTVKDADYFFSMERRHGRQRSWATGRSSPIFWTRRVGSVSVPPDGNARGWLADGNGPASAARSNRCTRHK